MGAFSRTTSVSPRLATGSWASAFCNRHSSYAGFVGVAVAGIGHMVLSIVGEGLSGPGIHGVVRAGLCRHRLPPLAGWFGQPLIDLNAGVV